MWLTRQIRDLEHFRREKLKLWTRADYVFEGKLLEARVGDRSHCTEQLLILLCRHLDCDPNNPAKAAGE